MDWIKSKERLLEYAKKYRYAIAVLALGLALMLIPAGKQSEDPAEKQTEPTMQSAQSLDQRLADILTQIKGAGKVKVMLTVRYGEEILYQTDQKITSSQTGTSQWETVIITDGNRAQSGLITQINPPSYQGAIIVCEGADKASVRLAVVEAVSKVTGLGADQISVLKMK